MFNSELNKLRENEDIESVRQIFFDNMDNIQEYKEQIHMLIKFSKENKLKRSEAWGYYFLGCYNFEIYNYEAAVRNFLTSYNIFEKLNNKHETPYPCKGLTKTYCRLGQFKLANEWALKGMTFCEETGNEEAIVLFLINTGINYIQMKDYSKAKEIFESIKRMNLDLTSRQGISYMISMAEIEINIGSLDKGLTIIDELQTQSYNHANESKILKLKAMALAKKGHYEAAEEYYINSLNISEDHGLIYEKCFTILELSKLYTVVENYKRATELLDETTTISLTYKLKTILNESYYLAYEIYKRQKLTDIALEYLEKHMKIKDEMYDYEQNQLIVKMKLKSTKLEAEQYKELYNRTELLSTIGQKIISNLNISSIINIIKDEINKLLKADYFGIAIYDSEKDQSTYYFTKENLQVTETLKYSNEDTFGNYCIKNKEDIIIGNKLKEYSNYLKKAPRMIGGFSDEDKVSSLIYTPMIINDRVVGAMSIQSTKENLYNKDDLNILKILANYTAIAVENAIMYKKIEDIATCDNLTKFYNKMEILKLGDLIYEKHKNKKHNFSVIMMDLDNFKVVNDTYGHIYGDTALSLVAEAISKCIRSSDYIGRFGGDEFLLICPGTGLSEALDIAERIRSTVEKKLFSLGDGIYVSLTLSLGVHQSDDRDECFIDVLKRADQYLYLAKDTDRNIVICK
ncbi:MAG: diguanylate cyclase [Tissierellia bacterium]|nr:diguanylate cyclase [Tissierellia bacterium]